MLNNLVRRILESISQVLDHLRAEASIDEAESIESTTLLVRLCALPACGWQVWSENGLSLFKVSLVDDTKTSSGGKLGPVGSKVEPVEIFAKESVGCCASMSKCVLEGQCCVINRGSAVECFLDSHQKRQLIWDKPYFGSFENEQIRLVVALQEFAVNLDRLLPGQDMTKFVVSFFGGLVKDKNFRQQQTKIPYIVTTRQFGSQCLQEVLRSTLDKVEGELVGKKWLTCNKGGEKGNSERRVAQSDKQPCQRVDMGRSISSRWTGEERKEEPESLISVGKRKTGVKNALHRVDQERDIFCLFVDRLNHI